MGDTLISIIAIVTPFIFAAWVINTKRSRTVRKDNRDEELEKDMRELAERIENLEIIFRNKQDKER
ncbi:MAG: hypothetical protein PQJ47_05505 [Sphaerochaetaceae bacterium]|nr:hypothetical protein [Sphaerochaetaceae bacterium]MDC7246769.1 hypothetical protein [Sphaerochaetaceae bacterium]